MHSKSFFILIIILLSSSGILIIDDVNAINNDMNKSISVRNMTKIVDDNELISDTEAENPYPDLIVETSNNSGILFRSFFKRKVIDIYDPIEKFYILEQENHEFIPVFLSKNMLIFPINGVKLQNKGKYATFDFDDDGAEELIRLNNNTVEIIENNGTCATVISSARNYSYIDVGIDENGESIVFLWNYGTNEIGIIGLNSGITEANATIKIDSESYEIRVGDVLFVDRRLYILGNFTDNLGYEKSFVGILDTNSLEISNSIIKEASTPFLWFSNGTWLDQNAIYTFNGDPNFAIKLYILNATNVTSVLSILSIDSQGRKSYLHSDFIQICDDIDMDNQSDIFMRNITDLSIFFSSNSSTRVISRKSSIAICKRKKILTIYKNFADVIDVQNNSITSNVIDNDTFVDLNSKKNAYIISKYGMLLIFDFTNNGWNYRTYLINPAMYDLTPQRMLIYTKHRAILLTSNGSIILNISVPSRNIIRGRIASDGAYIWLSNQTIVIYDYMSKKVNDRVYQQNLISVEMFFKKNIVALCFKNGTLVLRNKTHNFYYHKNLIGEPISIRKINESTFVYSYFNISQNRGYINLTIEHIKIEGEALFVFARRYINITAENGYTLSSGTNDYDIHAKIMVMNLDKEDSKAIGIVVYAREYLFDSPMNRFIVEKRVFWGNNTVWNESFVVEIGNINENLNMTQTRFVFINETSFLLVDLQGNIQDLAIDNKSLVMATEFVILTNTSLEIIDENLSLLGSYNFSHGKAIISSLKLNTLYCLVFSEVDNNTQVSLIIGIGDASNPTATLRKPRYITALSAFITNCSKVELNFTLEDDTKLDTLLIQVGNYLNITHVNSGYYATSMELDTELEEGKYVFIFFINDTASRYYKINATIIIDRTPPIINTSIPEISSKIDQRINISVSDNYLVYFSSVFIDDLLVYNGSDSNIIINTSLAEGTHIIIIISWDFGLNTMKEEHTIKIDISNPNLTIYKPVNNSFVNSKAVIILAEAFDNITYIEEIRVIIDQQLVLAESATLINKTLELDAGTHEILIRAIDAAGNSIDKIIVVTIDLDSPTVMITGIENESVVYPGVITVNINATDNTSSIRQILILVNGSLEGNLSSSSGHLNITVGNPGLYIIEILAIDRAGNIGRQILKIHVIQRETEMDWVFIVSALFALTFAISFIVFAIYRIRYLRKELQKRSDALWTSS
ncbi:MAG: hypothetical protein Q6351_005835 [Candidatus Njordarchaeum guaymaensis]